VDTPTSLLTTQWMGLESNLTTRHLSCFIYVLEFVAKLHVNHRKHD